MKKNKFCRTFIIVFIEVMLVLALISGVVNWFRIYDMQKPIFTIPVNVDENGQGTYYGMGYAVKVYGKINKYTKEYEQTRTDYYVLGLLISSFDHKYEYK